MNPTSMPEPDLSTPVATPAAQTGLGANQPTDQITAPVAQPTELTVPTPVASPAEAPAVPDQGSLEHAADLSVNTFDLTTPANPNTATPPAGDVSPQVTTETVPQSETVTTQVPDTSSQTSTIN